MVVVSCRWQLVCHGVLDRFQVSHLVAACASGAFLQTSIIKEGQMFVAARPELCCRMRILFMHTQLAAVIALTCLGYSYQYAPTCFVQRSEKLQQFLTMKQRRLFSLHFYSLQHEGRTRVTHTKYISNKQRNHTMGGRIEWNCWSFFPLKVSLC